MNQFSSRSHSIFTFFMSDPRQPGRPPTKLVFVDLAGSERNYRSKSEGKTFSEAKKINLSLLTLEKVILSFERASEGVKTHFPFRESNLTQLLRSLFEGDSLMTIICNISPEERDLPETLNTLKFCSRCKNLKIQMVAPPQLPISDRTIDNITSGELFKYQNEIKIIQKALERASNELKRAQDELSIKVIELDTLRRDYEELQSRFIGSNLEITPQKVEEYKEKAEAFMDGRIERLELKSIAEAHLYLEFVRQIKDLHTKNLLKKTQEISKKLEGYSVVHEQGRDNTSSR